MSWRWDGGWWVDWHVEVTLPSLSTMAAEAVEPSWIGAGKFSYQVKADILEALQRREQKTGKNPELFL